MAPQEQAQHQVLLAGDVSDFNVGAIVTAFGLGRQGMRLDVLDEKGDCAGSIVTKAGRVVSASAGESRGTDAVRRLLALEHPARFRVLREPQSLTDTPDQASDILEGAPLAEPAEPEKTTRMPTGVWRKRRVPLFEGSLETVALADLMRAIAVSRQYAVIEIFDEHDGHAGVMHIKAGQVLWAQAGAVADVQALHELCNAPASFRFGVFRESHPVARSRPLGSVTQLLQACGAAGQARSMRPADRAQQVFERNARSVPPPPPRPSRRRRTSDHTHRDNGFDQDEHHLRESAAQLAVPVLDGMLADFDLRSVLQVTGTSRQHTCVRVFSDAREPVGEVHLKSGQVVAATADSLTGVDALRQLLHSPRDFTFVVLRRPNLDVGPTSLGPLGDVLREASTHQANPHRASPSNADNHSAYKLSTPGGPTPPPELRTELRLEPQAYGAATDSIRMAERPHWDGRPGWVGGAVFGAAFVLLGGAATTLLLRQTQTPTQTDISNATPRSAAIESSTSSPSSTPQAPASAPSPVPPAAPRVAATANDALFPSELPASDLTGPAIASMQAALKQLGYDPGPIDGIVGPRTRAGVVMFQQAEHLVPDGVLSSATRAKLARRVNGL